MNRQQATWTQRYPTTLPTEKQYCSVPTSKCDPPAVDIVDALAYRPVRSSLEEPR